MGLVPPKITHNSKAPLIYGDFTRDVFTYGVKMSTMNHAELENVCMVLFMYSLFREPVFHLRPFGEYGNYARMYNGSPNSKYAIDVPSSSIYLTIAKPLNQSYITVAPAYSDGLWFLTGPDIDQLRKTLCNNRISYPQDSRYHYMFTYEDELLDYDQAALLFLLEDCAKRVTDDTAKINDIDNLRWNNHPDVPTC